jgi:Ni/Co efflux regulator RcnB
MRKVVLLLLIFSFACAQAERSQQSSSKKQAENWRKKANNWRDQIRTIDAEFKGICKNSRRARKLIEKRNALMYFAKMNEQFAAIIERPLLTDCQFKSPHKKLVTF